MIRVMKPGKIAFISSFRPRQCGIATFTSDLIESIGKAGGTDFRPSVFAMESGDEHEYKRPVKYVIRRNAAGDYAEACDYINSGNFDAVSLQHEFGLFGGDGGSYISLLLKRLKVPVITTLHTVLEKPSSDYLNALLDICDRSDKIIIMNRRGIEMLTNIYGVPRKKIRLIPHGIPDIPFRNSNLCRQGSSSARKILMTFGLIGRNKGIEVMLRAMPEIIKSHPEILYMIVGTTHPEVVKHEGYSYRDELLDIVKKLRLENHVVFHDRYVRDSELKELLFSADIYVTPYLHKEQLTSGTLAFAVGAGKAVVSTPYWAAEELLADGRGKLVPFCDFRQMASAIVQILDNESLLNKMKMRAYQYGRAITWEKTGQIYWNLLSTEICSASVSSFMSHKIDNNEQAAISKTG